MSSSTLNGIEPLSIGRGGEFCVGGKDLFRQSDGTVTDPTTGLTWMRCSMGQICNGRTCTGTASTYTFDQANALTGTVTFAGQSDWRLPNVEVRLDLHLLQRSYKAIKFALSR